MLFRTSVSLLVFCLNDVSIDVYGILNHPNIVVLEKEMSTHSTGESQARGSLVGYHAWGCTESGTTEVT